MCLVDRSALDIFGGSLSFDAVVQWQRQQEAAVYSARAPTLYACTCAGCFCRHTKPYKMLMRVLHSRRSVRTLLPLGERTAKSKNRRGPPSLHRPCQRSGRARCNSALRIPNGRWLCARRSGVAVDVGPWMLLQVFIGRVC